MEIKKILCPLVLVLTGIIFLIILIVLYKTQTLNNFLIGLISLVLSTILGLLIGLAYFKSDDNRIARINIEISQPGIQI